MNCHYDTDRKAYLLPDDEPCTHDEFGLPSRHCTARKTCSQHIGWDELTCARCVGRSRQDVRAIVDRCAELLPEALNNGTESEAFMLAVPGANYETFSARRLINKQWLYDHVPESNLERAVGALIPDDDERHPFNVLTRAAWLTARLYGLTEPDVWNISNAAAVLYEHLNKLAQDEAGNFAQLARELRKTRNHLESVLAAPRNVEQKGAPCPDCKPEHIVRLVRHYSHWCDDPNCERFHDTTDENDKWICPRDQAHWWWHYDYGKYIEERKSA